MTIAVEQSKTNGAAATSVAVTLDGPTTNGNFLLVLAGRVIETSEAPLGVISGGSWQTLFSEVCANSEANAYLFAAWLAITANQNSVTIGYTGNAENLSVALYEISVASMQFSLADSAFNDLAGTANNVALGPVDALAGDLIVAVGNLHDNDGTTPSFSNSFTLETENEETTGSPDQAFCTGYLIAPSDAAYSTTLSWASAPGADQRDGFMLVLHELGSFPATGILDNFNRANGPLGANWSTPIWAGEEPLTIDGQEVTTSLDNWCSGYWNVTTFANTEAYFTYTTIVRVSLFGLCWRLSEEGTGGLDGYYIDIANDQIVIFRQDNEVETQLGAAVEFVFNDGDKFGISHIGGTITLYIDDGGAGWGLNTTREDDTYASGHIGISLEGEDQYFDDFGGGEVGGQTYQAEASNGLKMGEAVARIGTFPKIILDGLKAGETVIRIGRFLRAVSDGLKAGETVARIGKFPRTASDGMKIGDSPSKIATLQGLISDGLKAGDSPARRAILQALASDGLSAGDAPSKITTLFSQALDGAVLGDTSSVVGTFYLSISDGAKLGDSPSGAGTFPKAVADGAKLGDSPSGAGTFPRALADGLTLGETLTVAAMFTVLTSEGAKFGDSAAWETIIAALAEDGIKIGDNTAVLLQALASAADGITMGENLAPALKALVSVADGIKAGDTTAARATFHVEVTDGAKLGETLAAIMSFAAVVTDGFKVGDFAVHALPTGEVIISFTARSGKIEFRVKAPGVAFTAKKPEITFH